MKMKNNLLLIFSLGSTFCFGFFLNPIISKQNTNTGEKRTTPIHTVNNKKNNMKLGAFSISLNVKDIHVSKAFYENLGFTVLGGSLEKKYLIMKNENSLIGLFQGMFENNILTFNPGWDENAKNIETFDDVREIQKELKSKGVPLASQADENTTGPAFIMLNDPDNNVIYIDQHR